MPTCLTCLGKWRAKRSRKVPKGSSSQKRSPASVATERGAESNIPKLSRGIERYFFYVTHGQATVGFVEQAGKNFATTAADRHDFRVFERFKAAADHVSKSCGGRV